MATGIVVTAALGSALLVINIQANRTADRSIDKALTATQSSIDDALATRSQALLQVSAGLAQVPDYVARIHESLDDGNRSNLLDQADEFRDQTGATWALLTDGAGVLRAWTYARYMFGDDLSESSLIGKALEGDSVQGTWIEPTDQGDVMFQAVAVPIFDPRRTSIYGVLVTGQEIDEHLAADLKRHTNSDIVFFSVDTLGTAQVLFSTLTTMDLDTAVAGLDPATAFGDTTSRPRLRLHVGHETLIGTAGPLLTASGYPVGGYVGLRSRSVEMAAFTDLRRFMIFAFVGGLALAVLSSLVATRHITLPLRTLVEATRRVAAGQYSREISVRSQDEIGQLAQAFGSMVAELKEKQELVDLLSGAGATVQLSPEEVQQVTTSDEARVPATQTTGAVTRRLSLGMTLAGRYRIQTILGSGGMGVVYRAHDLELDEPVAIKTLRPDALDTDTTLLERFKQEIKLARRITHRNVVRTHDLAELEGLYYITMEFVEGTTLKALIEKRGTLPVGVTLTIGKQVCRALEVAHEEGVIHRDIKPQNVLVDPSGFVKVMDFGIARLAVRRDAGRLTEVGATIGTPEYMAPEQLMGEEVDTRTDIYATGALLYESATGRTVYSAPTLPALIAKHLEGEGPDDPRSTTPDLPPELATCIMRALARVPADRYQSATEMLRALELMRV